MIQDKKKILFISHSAMRTGAPVLLFNIGKLLNETGSYEIKTLLRSGGELETEFSQLGDTFIWTDYVPLNRNRKLIQRIIYRFFYKKKEDQKRNKLLAHLRKSDFIINNTITNGELLETLLVGYKGKVISYIHEMYMGTLRHSTMEGTGFIIKFSNEFLTPSESVKKYLQYNFNVSKEKIKILNSYIPEFTMSIVNQNIIYRSDRFVVGGCGTADFGKGIDVFILLARYLVISLEVKNIFFIWKGIDINSELYKYCKIDIDKSGLNDFISILPADDNMADYYNQIDILLLTSREDSYPLVILEAASFGKPTICFENAGGAPEFVQDDAGSVVPYLDIPALANELLMYQSNPDLLLQKGKIAKDRVRQKHQDKNLVLNQLSEIFRN